MQKTLINMRHCSQESNTPGPTPNIKKGYTADYLHQNLPCVYFARKNECLPIKWQFVWGALVAQLVEPHVQRLCPRSSGAKIDSTLQSLCCVSFSFSLPHFLSNSSAALSRTKAWKPKTKSEKLTLFTRKLYRAPLSTVWLHDLETKYLIAIIWTDIVMWFMILDGRTIFASYSYFQWKKTH